MLIKTESEIFNLNIWIRLLGYLLWINLGQPHTPAKSVCSGDHTRCFRGSCKHSTVRCIFYKESFLPCLNSKSWFNSESNFISSFSLLLIVFYILKQMLLFQMLLRYLLLESCGRILQISSEEIVLSALHLAFFIFTQTTSLTQSVNNNSQRS